jgi:hypothetical protein
MAKAIAARHQGDDYQARFFWLHACRLFQERTKVSRVIYEAENVKSLDDVVVEYEDNSFLDEQGDCIRADYFQVKFHVTAAGAFTGAGMTDPAFINAKSVSILERLYAAQQAHAPNGKGCRFNLYSPWSVDLNDPLAEILRQKDGSLDLEKLFAARPLSRLGRMRAAWAAKLGGNEEAELKTALRPLRIVAGPTLQELGERLNDKLQLAGLAPVDPGKLVHPYDDLTRKCLVAHRLVFDRAEVEKLCKQAGLWVGYPVIEPDAYRIGIKSFSRWAEHLEDETDATLDLVRYFDGRKPCSPDIWHTTIVGTVQSFLSRELKDRNRRCHLHLQCHASIALAAGYCLDPKSGFDVAPVQSTRSGRYIWRPDRAADCSALACWRFSEVVLNSKGTDVALAICVTHDIGKDVECYARQSLPSVRRLIVANLSCGPGPMSVKDGTHARHLTDQIGVYLRSARTHEERHMSLHLFSAAPNAMLFFFGQQLRSFGRVVYYEHDFECGSPSAYEASIRFPVTTAT